MRELKDFVLKDQAGQPLILWLRSEFSRFAAYVRSTAVKLGILNDVVEPLSDSFNFEATADSLYQQMICTRNLEAGVINILQTNVREGLIVEIIVRGIGNIQFKNEVVASFANLDSYTSVKILFLIDKMTEQLTAYHLQ